MSSDAVFEDAVGCSASIAHPLHDGSPTPAASAPGSESLEVMLDTSCSLTLTRSGKSQTESNFWEQDERPGNPLPEYVADYAFQATARSLLRYFHHSPRHYDRSNDGLLLETCFPSPEAARHRGEPALDGEDSPSYQAQSASVPWPRSLHRHGNQLVGPAEVSPGSGDGPEKWSENGGAPFSEHAPTTPRAQRITSSPFSVSSSGQNDLQESRVSDFAAGSGLHEPPSLPLSVAMSTGVSPLQSPLSLGNETVKQFAVV